VFEGTTTARSFIEFCKRLLHDALHGVTRLLQIKGIPDIRLAHSTDPRIAERSGRHGNLLVADEPG